MAVNICKCFSTVALKLPGSILNRAINKYLTSWKLSCTSTKNVNGLFFHSGSFSFVKSDGWSRFILAITKFEIMVGSNRKLTTLKYDKFQLSVISLQIIILILLESFKITFQIKLAMAQDTNVPHLL